MEADLDGSYVCQEWGHIGGGEGRITREVVEILGVHSLGLSSGGNDDMIIYSSPEQNFSMN